MIIIGEKINATRRNVKQMIENRLEHELVKIAKEQTKAGASYIDVNTGTGSGTQSDEVESMEWAVGVILNAVDKPICIDSADEDVLEAGLRASGDRVSLVNSTKAEVEHLDRVVPLAKAYDAGLVALAMDEKGIPETVTGRLEACSRITDYCIKCGFPTENIYFDPLVFPVSTDQTQGLITLTTLEAIKKEYPGSKTVMGISNVSFGLPGRAILNSGFLQMAIYAGLDAVIMDPMDEKMMSAVRTGEALTGRDRHFRRFSRAWRNQKK